MKKLFTFVAIAALAVACCSKPATLTVEKFFENPAAFVDQDITIAGTIQCVDCFGQFVLGADDKQLLVVPVSDDITVNAKCVGKHVIVTGLVTEVIVDAEFIVELENEANASENEKAKETKLRKAGQYREILATDGVFSIYTIAATSVTTRDGKRCGEKAEGCCKGEKKACGEKAEGCCKGDKKACGENAEGCCKGGEKKACGEGAKQCAKPCGTN